MKGISILTLLTIKKVIQIPIKPLNSSFPLLLHVYPPYFPSIHLSHHQYTQFLPLHNSFSMIKMNGDQVRTQYVEQYENLGVNNYLLNLEKDINQVFINKSMQTTLLNNKYRIVDSKFVKGGAYGLVNKAIDTQTNQIVAVKEIKNPVNKDGLNPTVLRQRAILYSLNDNNIVKLIETFIDDGKAYLVFPYFKMNLKEFIKDHYFGRVPLEIVRKIMKQLFLGLRAAHSARFMHRDIKTENILVDYCDDTKRFTLKLADWGASRKLDVCENQKFTDYAIPRIFRPPELLFQSKKYSESVDIWSMGCLFYELLFSERMFPHVSTNRLLNEIQMKIGLKNHEDQQWIVSMYDDFDFEINEKDLSEFRKISLDSIFMKTFGETGDACDLLKKMLRINPQKRISAFDALKHPYFDFNI